MGYIQDKLLCFDVLVGQIILSLCPFHEQMHATLSRTNPCYRNVGSPIYCTRSCVIFVGDDILLLLLLLSSSSSSSPLCRVFILIFLGQTMSLGNTVLQLFCYYYYYFGTITRMLSMNLDETVLKDRHL